MKQENELRIANYQLPTTLAAIVLAAGLSRRMGAPKMLLPWGQTTVLGQVVSTLAKAITDARTDLEAEKRIREWMASQNRQTVRSTEKAQQRIMAPKVDLEILVVTGGAREAVEAEVARLEESFPARTVFNPQHEAGEMMSSIRAGLAGLGPQVAATFIALGDQPQLSLESARRVVSAWKISGSRLIIPSFNLRRGHPWLVGRELWGELAAANTAREFLNAHAGEILYVDCDETVLKDLDTPEDYARDLKSAR